MSQPRRSSTGAQRPQERQFDFLARIKYSNTLPDVPFDGKFLPCPFVSLDRFVDYKPSCLEKEHKSEVLCEADVGVHIDLINPATYAVPNRHVELDPKDQELIADESNTQQNLRRSAQHSKIVPWMRKTEYISSEFNRFGVAADRQEIKVGYNMQKQMKDEDTYRDRQSQVDAIAKTFEDVKKKVKKHYNKPGVFAVEECPLLPDFDLWKYSFAQVTFDADPAVLNAPESLQKTMMEQGQIRGMQDDSGEQFVTYFCPNVATIQKRMEDKEAGKSYDDEHAYEYPQNREYTWVVRNKGTKGYVQDTFFATFRDGCCYYNELGTRVKLTRRRKMFNKRAILTINHTDPTDDEVAQMTTRLQTLMNPFDGEGKEVEGDGESEEEAEESGAESDDSPRKSASKIKSDSEDGSDSDKKSAKSSDDSDSD